MISMFKVSMSPKAHKFVKKTLDSGMIGEGPRVQEFKEALEKRFKCKNLIPLNSGTSALILALRLTGVEGGEVITTPFTMIATNAAIRAAGATPVFADIKKGSVNIDPQDVKRKITSKTKAILVVHVGGIPCDMIELKRFGLPIIADAAHAIDTYYHGKHISKWADYTMFSFQSIKQLNTGDGGALVVKDGKQYKRAIKLKWFGMNRRVPRGMTRLEHQMAADVPEWGYKMHMNDIAASIGLANLSLLNKITSRQRSNAEYYKARFGSVYIPKKSRPSWWAYPVLVEDRKKFIKEMDIAGIETTPMWRRNDEYSCFSKADLPNMTFIQDKIVFIPVGWWLKAKERSYISENFVRINTP